MTEPTMRYILDQESEDVLLDAFSNMAKYPIEPDFDGIETAHLDLGVDAMLNDETDTWPDEVEFVIVNVAAHRTDPLGIVDYNGAVQILAAMRPYGDTLTQLGPNYGLTYLNIASVDNGSLTPSALQAVKKLHAELEDTILTYFLEQHDEDGEGADEEE